MLNQTVLVGRIAKDLEIKEAENKKETILTLAVSRSFKNENGEYETDFVPITLWGGIAINTCEYCKQGDVVGIRGHIQTKDGQIVIIADKLTFLSSKKKEEEEE